MGKNSEGQPTRVNEEEGEQAIWEGMECKTCSKHDTDGCNTQALCTWAQKYNTEATYNWRCGEECSKCGDGDTGGCSTMAQCLSDNVRNSISWGTVSWSNKLGCRTCGTHDQSGCTETECAAIPKEGRTYYWLTDLGECKRCGGGDIEGCITKASCEANTISWGEVVWDAEGSRCDYCGTHSVDGCHTKAKCEAVTYGMGIRAIWTGTFCMKGCSKDDIYACMDKAQCDAVGDANVQWDADRGSCTRCSRMGLDSRDECRATRVCMTFPEMVHEYCSNRGSACKWHCK